MVPTLQPTNGGSYELHTAVLRTKTFFPLKLPVPYVMYTHEQSLATCVQAVVL